MRRATIWLRAACPGLPACNPTWDHLGGQPLPLRANCQSVSHQCEPEGLPHYFSSGRRVEESMM